MLFHKSGASNFTFSITPVPLDNNTSLDVAPSLNDGDTNDSVEEAKISAKYEGNRRSLTFQYPS